MLRIVTAIFATFAIIVHHEGFARPGVGWSVLVGISLWTALICIAYSRAATRNRAVITADLVVTSALLACSALVLSPGQLTEVTERAPLLTTIWASGPIVAAAVHAGWVPGVLCATAISGMTLWVRGSVSVDLIRDTVLLTGAALALGLASGTARRTTVRLREAAHAEVARAERDRLARSIHDTVLQVLARVRARGSELGGEAAELIRLAGEQETTLRSLLSADPSRESGEEDLAAALRSLANPRVEVSVPATGVLFPAGVVDELVAATREALANSVRHGGPGVRSWVLLEDLGDEMVLTVRDDGPGVDTAALTTAAPGGRMGVAQSIRGRVRDLGGTAMLSTEPGRGTEWEVRLPRTRRAGS